jgi:hypothetical protein
MPPPPSPPNSVREAWAGYITAADYERHMAATGQPAANADLLAELFTVAPPPPGTLLLFAGAGTGQYFDYWDSRALAPYQSLFTDINPLFLERLHARLAPGINAETRLDDIEAPRAAGPFSLAIVMLTLEHVDWPRAVDALCGIATRVFTVIQQNPPDLVPSPLPGTLAVLEHHPRSLIDRTGLIARFAGRGLSLSRTSIRPVAGGKAMVGLDFAGLAGAARYHGAVDDIPVGPAPPES